MHIGVNLRSVQNLDYFLLVFFCFCFFCLSCCFVCCILQLVFISIAIDCVFRDKKLDLVDITSKYQLCILVHPSTFAQRSICLSAQVVKPDISPFVLITVAKPFCFLANALALRFALFDIFSLFYMDTLANTYY